MKTLIIMVIALSSVVAFSKTIKEEGQEYQCTAVKSCEEKLKIAYGDIAVLKRKTKIVEVTKIKKHIVSLLAVNNVKRLESKNISPSAASAEVVTDFVPALSYQYQTDGGLVGLLGLTFANKTKPFIGLGYEF